SSKGIPDDVVKHMISLPYNDEEVVRAFLRNNEIAAVILEPIAGNMGVVPASQKFIDMLREETAKQEALLIFDEVITGFRVALQGAQSVYGVTPDLTCFGKVIAGGFPAAAVGGRREIMDCLAPLGPVYQAGTLAGNPLAMEAGYQAIQLCEQKDFYENLQKKTDLITKPVQEQIKKKRMNICLQQKGSMFTIFFGRTEVRNQEEAKKINSDEFVAFFKYMYENGIYIPPSQHEAWFVSTAHEQQHLEKTRDLILSYLA
ncbi:MAG TPA: aminotransferase class III-fold pyridoxal phosphate-dependent enzyme, partial [Waddliaceae bacterium]